jgi:EAL domain-containing protein (putative c-di-GMP-specific phosphodiesterase class I)
VAVNIAGAELYCEDFADMVAGLVEQHQVPASRLVLEITEQSVITDVETAAKTMKALRQQGFRFAIDDFGTGYSSLRYLQQLPLDILKIDRSFTQLITQDTTSHELTVGILQIARTLNLAVVAEGVETAEQYAVLQQLGAGHTQGFLLGRPQPAAAITEQLKALQTLR